MNVPDNDSELSLHKASGYVDHGSVTLKSKRQKNSLRWISRLPKELSHFIFRLALPDPLDLPSSYYRSLCTLRQVSHIWEHDIVNTPLFWTPNSPCLHPSLQDLIWERSRNAAVEVNVSQGGSFYDSSVYRNWTKAERTFLARAMTRGLRALWVAVPPAESLDPYLVDHDHPRMRSLSLRGKGQLISTHPLRTPHLTELQLINCDITWNPLHNLRSLSVSRTCGMSLAQVIQTLHSSPLLEQIHLQYIEAPLEDPSNKAVIPLTPINLPQLSSLIISKVSPIMASGVLDRLVLSNTCRPSKIYLEVDQGLDLSDFCRHAGRICARGFTEQTTPHLQLNSTSLTLTLTPDIRLYIHRRPAWRQQHTVWRGTEYARHFFEGGKGSSSRVSHGAFRLRVSSKSEVAEGLAMMQEFFPKTVELEVTTWEGLEALESLADPMAEEDGNPVWRLPNLGVLKLRILQEKYGTGAFDYGRIVAMAIKRMRAAVSSPSALAPITLLTLRNGFILYELLAKLEETGIKYERDGVMAIVGNPY